MTTALLFELLSLPEAGAENPTAKPLGRGAMRQGAALAWWDARAEARTEERLMAESRRTAKALIRDCLERSAAQRMMAAMADSGKEPS